MHQDRTAAASRTVRSLRIPMLVFALLALPTAADAGPPTQLYGKSISITWAESQDQQLVSGEKKHVVIDAALGIYVSSNGRIFSRGSRTSRSKFAGRSTGFGAARSHDPTGSVMKTSNVRYQNKLEFQGRTLVGTTVLESGARRMTVNFDESFRTCTVSVVLGKEAGMPGVIARGMDTRLRIIESATVASQSCTITDGNMFGSGST